MKINLNNGSSVESVSSPKIIANRLRAWIADDITWCMEENCPMTSCRRNVVNMVERVGVHSYAMFKGTAECPVSRSLDECIDGCLYAKECFAKHDDPDDALLELEDEYCEKCAFASVEED